MFGNNKTTLTYAHCMHNENKCMFNSVNTDYLLIQDFLSFHVIFKTTQSKIYKTIIFSYCDVGVKIGLSHLIMNVDWCSLKTVQVQALEVGA
jgi:hypothetical protein